jgi:endonuclease/exonuclease/phosphatase family metal-dependent hydrolase
MKIATWNVERVSNPSKRHKSIVEKLENIQADILVLTETIENIELKTSYHQIHTSNLCDSAYKPFEKRVSVFTKYEIIQQINTHQHNTAVCATVKAPIGALTVYGTIIGIHGNRRQSFKADLELQIEDYIKIAQSNNLCIIGDLNMSFADNYYFTNEGRQKLESTFEKLQLTNLTKDIPENIDHIVLASALAKDKKVVIDVWNRDKKLSDHIGVAVTISD